MGKESNVEKTKSCWEKKEFKCGLLFATPWIFGFLAFSVYPLVSSLYYNLTKFDAVAAPKWVDLKSFGNVFSSPLVWKGLLSTLFISFVSTPINPTVALLLACIVTKNFRGKDAVRTAFFSPSVILMIATTMVWTWIFDPTYGYINNVLGWFGINGPAWLLNAEYTKWALVLVGAWSTNTIMLAYMAALQSIPKSYYESAEIDGAGSVRRFFCIILPCVAHVFVYQAILSIIDSFQHFQQVYIIITANASVKGGGAAGGLENSILMYPLYIFHDAFTYPKMEEASTIAWILFIIVAILTVIMAKVTKKVAEDAGGE